MTPYKSFMKFFVVISLLSSCFPTKESGDMIKYTSDKLNKYKTELEKIVAWAESESIYPKYCMDIDSSSRIRAFNMEEFDSKYLDNKNMELFLMKFYEDFNIYRISVTPETIYFDFKIRNLEMVTYSLNYARVPTPKTFAYYKIYSGTNKPTEPAGWLYKFEENWYLESRGSSN